MGEFIPCRTCAKSATPGYIYNTNTGIIKPCKCLIEYRKKEIILIKLKRSNIPDSVLDYNIKSYKGKKSIDIINKLKQYIKNYEEFGMDKHLYLYGINGTQKTTIGFYIAREIIRQGILVFYIPTMKELINKITVFENQITDDLRLYLNRINEAQLLIIDEAFTGSQFKIVSDFQIEALTNFLKNRMEIAQKSIIFISNSPVSEINKIGYSKTLQSLIERNTLNTCIEFKDVYESENKKFNINELWSE